MRGCQSTMASWRGVVVLIGNFEVSLNTVHVLIRGVTNCKLAWMSSLSAVLLPWASAGPVTLCGYCRRLPDALDSLNYPSIGTCVMWITDVIKYTSKRALLPGFWVQLWAFVMTVMNDRLHSVTFCHHLSGITCQRQTPCFEVISGNLHPPSEIHGCVQITNCLFHSGVTEW
jgi:hypothetical protein